MAAPKGNKFGVEPNKGNKWALGLDTSGRPKIWTREAILEQAKELLKWAATNDALVIREFSAIQGYRQQNISEWCKKEDEFSEAYDRALIIIGARREKLAMEAMAKRYAPMYDADLDAFESKKMREEIKAKAEAAAAEQLVPREEVLAMQDEIIKLKYELMKQRESIPETDPQL